MEAITAAQFNNLVAGLIGLPVSRPWRGYGSAIFLELGDLTKEVRAGHVSERGEGCVMIEWSWRVERKRSIAFGSWSGDRKIANGVRSLEGRRIESIDLRGRLPEISIQLTGARWLTSFMTAEGGPEWAIRVLGGSWLSVKSGRLTRGE